jgi:hypothetical protein
MVGPQCQTEFKSRILNVVIDLIDNYTINR